MQEIKLNLKPCPFCGGKAWMWTDYKESRMPKELYFVACDEDDEDKCAVQPETLRYLTKKAATKAWNRRAKE